MKPKLYILEIIRLKYYILPILFLIGLTYLFYNYADPNTAIFYGKEDGLFEWGTSLSYFLAFVFFLLTFLKTKNIFILLLTCVMFFGAGEELSWGQRIIGYETPPGMKKLNAQKEFNLHNISLVNGKNVEGKKVKGLSRLLVMDFLFKIFTGVFGIVIPFLIFHIKKLSDWNQKLKLPVAPISIGIFFLISEIGLKYSLSALPTFSSTQFYWKVYVAAVEMAEFIGAFIMGMIALYFYNNCSKETISKDIKQSLFSGLDNKELVRSYN